MDYTNPFKDLHAGCWTSNTSAYRSQDVRMSQISPLSSPLPSPLRKPSQRRPAGRPARHESSDSLSSINSSSSVPGMTDTSDSELSVDEDSQYHISTSQLWDSFWQSVESKTVSVAETRATRLPSSQSEDYFTLSVLDHYTSDPEDDEDDDTITIGTSKSEKRSSPCSQQPLRRAASSRQPPSPSSRPGSPRAPTGTYSIYPKPQPVPPARQFQLPPRTSSLASPRPVPPRPARSYRVNGLFSALKPSKSSHNLHAAQSEAAVASIPPLPQFTQSVPNSPGLPKPSPMSLRSSKSAFNLRNKDRKCKEAATHHNATAPLAPLLQESREPAPARPQLQRFVSVFELDSDCESDAENSSGLAKRIARGLHKKTPSGGKRNALPVRRPATAGDDSPSSADKVKEEDLNNSPGRRRGGSLGRILGLKYRS